MVSRRSVLTAGSGLLAGLSALGGRALPTRASGTPPMSMAAVTPTASPGGQGRHLIVSMVPVLTHEFQTFLPYLKGAFATGGMLDGKELFAFLPAHVAAYAGESLTFDIYNPADDPHTMTFLSLDKTIDVPGHDKATLALGPLAAGIYDFACLEEEHVPFMWGQLTVLPRPA
jgi:cupredoxin-like protein